MKCFQCAIRKNVPNRDLAQKASDFVRKMRDVRPSSRTNSLGVLLAPVPEERKREADTLSLSWIVVFELRRWWQLKLLALLYIITLSCLISRALPFTSLRYYGRQTMKVKYLLSP